MSDKQKPKTRQINVPSWAFELLKGAGYIAAAVCAMYVKVSVIERSVTDQASKLTDVTVQVTAKGAEINQVRERTSALEIKSGVTDKTVSDSLVRIETSLKEARNDIRELQKAIK